MHSKTPFRCYKQETHQAQANKQFVQITKKEKKKGYMAPILSKKIN